MTRVKKRADDLCQIKGIGPVRQDWLRQSLGVYTFRDLAAWPAEDLEARLREEGEIVSTKEIARWIAQARRLATEGEPVSIAAADEAPPDEPRGGALASPGKWKPFASFVVEYQSRFAADGREELRTSVHHIEADSGTAWPGIEPVKHCEWMRAQLAERERPRETTATMAAAAAGMPAVSQAPAEARVEIDQVLIFQPPEAQQPTGIARGGLPFGAPIRSGEAFALEAAYRVLGPEVSGNAAPPINCTAHFMARDFSAGDYTALGDALPEQTRAEMPKGFVARLPRVLLREGLYRLRVLVTPETGAAPGYAEIPMLQAV
jgi:hypothetical protein